MLVIDKKENREVETQYTNCWDVNTEGKRAFFSFIWFLPWMDMWKEEGFPSAFVMTSLAEISEKAE